LRTRIVLTTAILVTSVVVVGGGIMLLTLHSELLERAEDDAAMRAEEVASQAAEGRLPRWLPLAADETAVQVVVAGDVVSSTRNISSVDPLRRSRQGAGTDEVQMVDDLPIVESGPWLLAERRFTGPDGTGSVFAAVSVEDVEETFIVAGRVGVIGLAVLVLILCAIISAAVSRTLAPVEAIRARADAINGQQLSLRLPEPAGRDEIARLARTINAMLARLQDSAERQRRFVGDAAHELRSPIASLRTQLEVARERRHDEATTTLLQDLFDETVRMQTLVEQLLLLARNDTGSVLPRKVPVDLDETVDSAIASGRAGDRVPIDIDAVQPVQVTGDPDLLDHLIRNLLENAVRHARTRVWVALWVEEGDAVLTVDDDGAGIPPTHRDEVFRRFTRLDVARSRDHGGVGLGLAIAADIVRSHHGRITAAESPLGGARFTVRLPVGSPPGDAAGPPVETEHSPVTSP
jgi:signal transduction histidine kinase